MNGKQMILMSEEQQTLIRMAIGAEIQNWKEANHPSPWPYAEERIATLEELLTSLRRSQIYLETHVPAQLELIPPAPPAQPFIIVHCDRCEHSPCVCGDPDFEQQVSEDLRRASEVE